MDTKICRRCGTERSLSDFNIQRRNIDGHMAYCRVCTREMNADYRRRNPDKWKDWYANNPEKAKEKYRRSNQKWHRTKTLANYGLTEETFEIIKNYQKGKCAICLIVPSDMLVVDHDHNHGGVRACCVASIMRCLAI